LVFDLNGTGTGFDHFLGQQVGSFFVTETSVDVSDDGYNVSFEVVDLVQDLSFFGLVTSSAGFVQLGEQQIQLTGVSLAQESVQLFDQSRYRSLLVHGLVGQGAELRAQGGNHPAGQIEVALLGRTQVLLDSDQFLLTDEAVPATQRLGVFAAVSVVLSHVLAHDLGSVTSDIQTGAE